MTPFHNIESLQRLTSQLEKLLRLQAPPEIVQNQIILCRDRLTAIEQVCGVPGQTEIVTETMK